MTRSWVSGPVALKLFGPAGQAPCAILLQQTVHTGPPRRTAAALQADFHELEAQYQRLVLQYPGAVFIMGDLNCNMLDSTNSGRARLSEMLQSYHLHQFVAQPTYSSGSLLDVVISNYNDAVQRVGVFDCAF